MTNTDVKTGSGENQGKPEETPAESTSTTDLSRMSFGLEPDKKPGDPGNIDNKGDQKKTDEGDPDKGTTPADGSDKSKTGQEDSKLLAGKYQTPEALEAGYNELFSHHKTLSDENKSFKQEMAQLQSEVSKLKEAKSGEGDKEPTSKESTPEDDAKLKKAKENLIQMFGEDGYNDFLEHLKNNQKLSEEDQTAIDEIRAEKLNAAFYEKNPDAKEHTEEIVNLQLEFIKNQDDPIWLMEFFYNAAKGANLSKIIDKAVISKITSMSKADKEKLAASNLTSGQTSGAISSGINLTDKQKESREAFGLKV